MSRAPQSPNLVAELARIKRQINALRIRRPSGAGDASIDWIALNPYLGDDWDSNTGPTEFGTPYIGLQGGSGLIFTRGFIWVKPFVTSPDDPITGLPDSHSPPYGRFVPFVTGDGGSGGPGKWTGVLSIGTGSWFGGGANRWVVSTNLIDGSGTARTGMASGDQIYLDGIVVSK